jgi:hypothetical protein
MIIMILLAISAGREADAAEIREIIRKTRLSGEGLKSN